MLACPKSPEPPRMLLGLPVDGTSSRGLPRTSITLVLFLHFLNNLRSHLLHVSYPPLCRHIPSGVLQFGDLRYEIQPVENSSSFQHLIFRKALAGGSPPLCQVPREHQDLHAGGEIANGSRKILVIEVRAPHPLCYVV